MQENDKYAQLGTPEQLLLNDVRDMNEFKNTSFESQYIVGLKNILLNGTQSGDRTGTGTKRIQSQQIHVDMSKEFPILRSKQMGFKTALVEMMWIMTGRNDLKWLKDNGVNYWDSWVNKDRTMGPSYGPQMRNFGEREINVKTPSGPQEFNLPGFDQLRDTIKLLRETPDSRRIIVDLWNPLDIDKVSLPWCFLPNKNSVRVKNGEYKFIENIEIDDEVLTEDSTFQKVTNKMITPYLGDTKIIKHKLNKFGVETTPNHPFLVKDKGYVKAEDLRKGDYIGITNNYEKEITEYTIEYETNTRYGIVNKKFTIFKPQEWYMMGYYLGNGCLFKRNGVLKRYNICIPDKKRDEILTKINKCISLSISNNSGVNVKEFSGESIKWGLILEQFGHLATGKKIPDFITNSSPKLIRAFLDGYMDADGCELDNYYGATTVSKSLAYGIQSLYSKLNIPCKIHFIEKPNKTIILGREVNQNNVYSICVYKNKQNNLIFNENEKIKWSEISEIETGFYEGNVYNISVDNNHTYTVNNIINHNCHFFYQACSYIDNDGIRKIDLHVMQRSADSFLGVPYDLILFGIYLKILCLLTGYEIGWIHSTYNDFHMYSNHEIQVNQCINNYINDPKGIFDYDTQSIPEIIVNEEYLNIDFTQLDIDELLQMIIDSKFTFFKVENYKNNHYDKIEAKVAV